jgi:regulator of sigma E protease
MPKRGRGRENCWNWYKNMESPGLFLTLFAFLLLLGPLIVLHELGHYFAGRLFKVRADVFSIGMGKELWYRIDKRGTRWRLAAFPIGGYVLFAGDADASSKPNPELQNASPEQLKGTLTGAPLWQRALIVFAGPFANLLVAVLIIAAFAMGNGMIREVPAVVGFAEDSDARAAGVLIGDLITAVDGEPVEISSDVGGHVALYPGKTVVLSIRRGGQDLTVPVPLRSQDFEDRFGNKAKVADLGLEYSVPTVAEVEKDSAAERAGIAVGDRIVAVDGVAIDSFTDVRDMVIERPNETVAIAVLRDGEQRYFNVALTAVDAIDEQGKKVKAGRLGIINGQRTRLSPGAALVFGVEESVNIVERMVIGLKQIVVGDRSVKEMGGPVKIAQFSGQSMAMGWQAFIGFAAMISINLAFINLLPIPTLDGGHLAMYAAEAVRRKPLDEWAFRTGLALVLALVVFVTFNDLVSLFS